MDLPQIWLEGTEGQISMSEVTSMPASMKRGTALFPHTMKDSEDCWTSGLAVKKKETTDLPSPDSSILLQKEQNLSGLFNTSDIMDYDLMENMDIFDNIPSSNIYGEGDECLSSFLDLNDFLKEPSDIPKNDNNIETSTDMTSFTDFGALLEKAAIEFPVNENTDLLSLAVSDILESPSDNTTSCTTVSADNSILNLPESSGFVLPLTVTAEVLVADHDYVKVKSEDAEEIPIKKRPSANKYKERRIKNNIASKRSREIRKQKFVEMEGKADELIKENALLREKITQLETLTKEMKAILIKKMVEK